MMLFRLFVLTVGIGLLMQCSGDSDIREKAKAEAEQLAHQSAASKPAPTVASNELADVRGASLPTTGETMTIVMGSTEVSEGEEACLPVSVTGFTDLIGLQFSMRWNPEELKYVAVRDLNLTDLGPQNFGDTYNELGVVALSWVHQSLQGVTLPASSRLFDICFIPQTKAGSSIEVRFEPRPVSYEVINVKEDLLQFAGVDAIIKVQ